jgi:hypothetical protein
VTEFHDGSGEPVRIERLLPTRDVCEPHRDGFGAISGGEDEGYAFPLQVVGKAEGIVPAQVYVNDPDIEPAAGKQVARVVEVADKGNHVRAERAKCSLQVVGQKPLILDNEDPAFSSRFGPGHLASPQSLKPADFARAQENAL